MNENKTQDFVQEDESRETLKFSFKDLMAGKYTTMLVFKNIRYIIFLTLLGLLYIGNRYHAQSVSRHIERLNTEIENLRTAELVISRDLTQMTREQQVIQQVEQRGLPIQPSVKPPVKIKK